MAQRIKLVSDITLPDGSDPDGFADSVFTFLEGLTSPTADVHGTKVEYPGETPTQVPTTYVAETRVPAIRQRMRENKAHPEDVAWLADEAVRLQGLRATMAAEIKRIREFEERVKPWLQAVAEFDLADCRDGDDYSELAGGWREEATNLMAGRKATEYPQEA